VLEAFGWGFLAQSSLFLAGLLVCWVTVPTKVVGILGGFGAGAMIAAVSFDLLPEAPNDIQPGQTGLTISLGFVAAVFISNIPQAIAPSADLAASGWGPRRLGQLWLLVVLACGVAAALGFLATDLSGPCRATARRHSRQEACSRCLRTH
jgi:zinc transporter, ZIP family